MLKPSLNPKYAITRPYFHLQEKSNSKVKQNLLAHELRWHISAHYFSESAGEEAIESIMMCAPSTKCRQILSSQIKDEINHKKLYKKIIDKIGIETRAHYFADNYLKLIKEHDRFVEKVYIMQMLTEAASAMYTSWRLKVVDDPFINSIDHEVNLDETRHLAFSYPLLDECPRELVIDTFKSKRFLNLFKQMVGFAESGIKKDLFSSVTEDFGLENNNPCRQSIDFFIKKVFQSEYLKFENYLEYQSKTSN